MLNQVSNELHPFLEGYLENIETLPCEIQLLISSYRELNYQMKELMERLRELFKSLDDKQALSNLKKLLIDQKEIGDQKLELLQKAHELCEGSNKNAGLTFRNDFIENSLSLQPNLTFNTNEMIISNNNTLNNNLNNATNNIENQEKYNYNNDSLPTIPTRSSNNNNSASNNNSSNNNNNKFDKIKRQRRLRASMHVDDSKDDDERPRKKKTRRCNKINEIGLTKVLENVDPHEPVYCLCQQVSYGEMIGCDNEACEVEWFHFRCVSLVHKPKGKWYCPSCRGDRQSVLSPELAEIQKKARKGND